MATYQDILDAPPHKIAEIADGEFHLSPHPDVLQTVTRSALCYRLHSVFDDTDRGGPGGWWILHQPEVHFSTEPDGDILVPDIAGWRRENTPVFPNTAFFSITPDLGM